MNIENFHQIRSECKSYDATLVAVSKTKSNEEITQVYDQGQRDFGENYVQELKDKQLSLPNDINWHFIGHLQSNKVKSIVPLVSLIHGCDSLSLLMEIDKQAKKQDKVVNCLLQVYIASEETKFGFTEEEIEILVKNIQKESLSNTSIIGMMGMASFTEDTSQIRKEFKSLYKIFSEYQNSSFSIPGFEMKILSMGMTSDYKIALEEGSNMIRIGSAIFGERNYKK